MIENFCMELKIISMEKKLPALWNEEKSSSFHTMPWQQAQYLLHRSRIGTVHDRSEILQL